MSEAKVGISALVFDRDRRVYLWEYKTTDGRSGWVVPKFDFVPGSDWLQSLKTGARKSLGIQLKDPRLYGIYAPYLSSLEDRNTDVSVLAAFWSKGYEGELKTRYTGRFFHQREAMQWLDPTDHEVFGDAFGYEGRVFIK